MNAICFVNLVWPNLEPPKRHPHGCCYFMPPTRFGACPPGLTFG